MAEKSSEKKGKGSKPFGFEPQKLELLPGFEPGTSSLPSIRF